MEPDSAPSPAAGTLVVSAVACWFLAAFAVSISGLLYGAPAPVVRAINWGLILFVLGAVYIVQSLGTWASRVPVRWLILYHAVRFVGIAFLVLHARGAPPAAFAIHAGWGDIAVAATALGVVFGAAPVTASGRWWTVLVWNALGLLDILFVIGSGMRLGLEDMAQMSVMTAFPLSLLPLFIVPLIIVTHVLIFMRLWRGQERAM